ncbi:translesion DNA synthesis-associated protein ImuA [soil metagenome]
MKTNPVPAPEAIHPSLWRASQLARGMGQYLASGYEALSAELPGGGWPMGALTELFIQHRGSAEIQLLQPALTSLKQGHIALLQPPYQPQALAMSALGIDAARLLWIRCQKHSDALWAAEQILRNGSCSALLFWQNQIKTESLRRLHLAAQGGQTLFCMIRPPDYALTASPAPLRLKIHMVMHGLQIDFIKRRGIQRQAPLFLSVPALSSMFSTEHIYADNTIEASRHATTGITAPLAGTVSAFASH